MIPSTDPQATGRAGATLALHAGGDIHLVGLPRNDRVTVLHAHLAASPGPLGVHGGTVDDPPGLIVCAAHAPDGGTPPVALLVDLDGIGRTNHGQSATNAADRVIDTVAPMLAAALDVHPGEIEWAEIDSDGRFDQLTPVWQGGHCVNVGFQPLRPAPGENCPSRSAGALGSRYPRVASLLLARLSAATRGAAAQGLQDDTASGAAA